MSKASRVNHGSRGIHDQIIRAGMTVGKLSVFALVLLGFPVNSQAQSSNHGGHHLFGGAPQFVHRPKASNSASKSLSAEQQKKYDSAVKTTITAEKNLSLQVGLPQILVFNRPPIRIQIPNDDVATVTTISQTELSVLATEVGSTVLNIWFEKEGAPEEYEILSYLISSYPDPGAKSRANGVYAQLQSEVNMLFPDSHIELVTIGDKVVVKGTASDIVEAAQIISIIQSETGSSSQDLPLNLNVDLNNPGPEDLPSIREYLISGPSNVINMLTVPEEKQIALRVTVAEVNRLAARSIGFNFMFIEEDGDLTISNLTGGVLGSGNLPFAYVNNTSFQASLRALRGLNFAKSLAEPTLVTMNGTSASFSTGGQFPIPIVTGSTSDGLQGVAFQDFGVSLDFTPFTLNSDKIRITINGEVSTTDEGGGGQIENTQVPGLETRDFNTTVELREGETLAIAGILQTEQRQQSQNIPLLGDLPFIGNLFGNREVTSSEQELIVLITPEIVESLTYDQVPALPGDDNFEPDDIEFYLLGRTASRADVDFRSTVQNDFDRLRWHRLEQKYLFGPSGYTQSSTIEF